jgi:hypothetical protein
VNCRVPAFVENQVAVKPKNPESEPGQLWSSRQEVVLLLELDPQSDVWQATCAGGAVLGISTVELALLWNFVDTNSLSGGADG